MKKIVLIISTFVLVLISVGCNNSEQSKQEPEKAKIEDKQKTVKDTKTTNTKETKITSGEMFDKINSVEKVKRITTIKDTEIGFINLNLGIDIPKGTAMDELDAFVKKAAKIQTELKEYFISQKFLRITYAMYIDNEMKSVLIEYKKQNNNYTLENTTILDEKYQKAADALK